MGDNLGRTATKYILGEKGALLYPWDIMQWCECTCACLCMHAF